jgi:dihydroorotate dehydrogenase electron transfer subunit
LEAAAPPCVVHQSLSVVLNEQVARDTFRLRLDAPQIARTIIPGQFLMVRAGTTNDPLLGRPFAVYDVVRDSSGTSRYVDVVYLVIGRGTAALAQVTAGKRLPVWGPLGNGFGPAPSTPGPTVFVAGGIGQTPFLALGKWWMGQESYGERDAGPSRSSPVTLFYGVRTKDFAAGLDDFARAGIAVELATDDGSAGHHGFVTELLQQRLEGGDRPAKVVGCGPPAMLNTLARLVANFAVPCDLSLENHMACGFGACFSCVAPIRQADGSVDLRRVCVEGPIFPAADVVLGGSSSH